MWQKIEFHFKKLNRKTDWKCPKLLHQKHKLQTYLKGGKIESNFLNENQSSIWFKSAYIGVQSKSIVILIVS